MRLVQKLVVWKGGASFFKVYASWGYLDFRMFVQIPRQRQHEDFEGVSLQKHMDHVRPTTNLAKKPPQRLAQEKDRTHERDATPMFTKGTPREYGTCCHWLVSTLQNFLMVMTTRSSKVFSPC